MNLQTRYLFGLLIIILQFPVYAFEIYSPTGEPVPAQMDQEEARLNILNSRTNEVVFAHGNYAITRDNLFLGNDGILMQSKAWYSDASVWLALLDSIVTSFQTNNISQLAQFSVRNKLRTQINSAHTEFLRLSSSAASIRSKSQSALNTLADVRRFPAQFVTDFDAPIVGLVARANQLEDAVIAINNTLNISFISATKLALSRTHQISELLLKSAVLNTQYAAIQGDLKMMESVLLAENIVAPLYAELLEIKIKINTLVNDSMPFNANSQLAIMQTKSTQAIATINSAGIGATEAQSGIDRINALLFKAQNSVSLIMNAPEAAIVSLYRKLAGIPVLYCRYPIGQKKFNCPLMKSLGGLTNADIYAMTPADLRYFEDSIKRVYDGPITIGGI
ncbi:MAG: hypothetical protein ACC707_00265 [Thiohalomonadales bacterium]